MCRWSAGRGWRPRRLSPPATGRECAASPNAPPRSAAGTPAELNTTPCRRGDVEGAAGRERAFFGGEPGNGRRDLLDEDEPAHRDLRQHEVNLCLGHLGKKFGSGGRRG